MKAWLMAKKDLAIFARDRLGVLLGFGLPIVLATVFGAALGAFAGDGEAMGRVTLFVEDHDASDASRALVEGLRGSDGLELRAVDPTGGADDGGDGSARDLVAKGDGPAGLLIPSGFGAAVEAGEPPPLTLFRDPGRAIEQQVVAGSLIPLLFDAAGETLGRRAMRESLERFHFPAAGRGEAEAVLEDSWSALREIAARTGPSATGGDEASTDGTGFDLSSLLSDLLGIEIEDVVGGGDAARARRVAVQAHAVAGIAVMMLLFGLVACGGTLLEEEAAGTLERLRLAPGAARAVLGGKFLFTWIVGLVQLVVLFAYGRLIFDLPIFRAPAALLLLSAVVAAAATGFGVLFSVVCRSRKQLEGLSTLVILLMSALGGSWFPLTITPGWYQDLGHFTLTAWAMDGYQAIFWYDLGLADILSEIGVLAAIAIVTSGFAFLLWNRRLRV